VIGAACRFPGAPDPERFWRNLRDGVESITFFSREELIEAGHAPSRVDDPAYVRARGVVDGIELFDASFFGLTAREAEITDPQHRLFLECSWEALEDAGYDPFRYPDLIGVFGGESSSTYQYRFIADSKLRGALSMTQLAIGMSRDYLTTRLSYKLDLRGPSLSVQTACSTSLVALSLACQSLSRHECDMALAGGSSVRIPVKSGYLFLEGGIASPDGHCRAFDARAQGAVGGSGAGVVLLKRLEDALRDGDHVRAVVRGWATNNDGAMKIGFTAPSAEGQAEVIAMAMAAAGVEADDISYVEAHGTATPLGDPIEVSALTEVFRETSDRRGFCALGSVKTNIGHTDAAAGIAGFLKTVLALEHREIPPSLHFERPNPEIDFASSPFYVNAALAPWETNGAPRRAGVSSFGIGGTNAHVVLEEAPETPETPETREEPAPARAWHMVPLSARSEEALERAAANLAAWLERHPDLHPADVAWTLQIGRRPFEHRRIAVVSGLHDSGKVFTGLAAGERSAVFLFPGQGAQHAGMARELWESEPAFRETLERCAAILRPDLDLLALLFPPAAGEEEAARRLIRTAAAQPALFAVEYALADLLERWGVRPSAMIGHSLGEYVAACRAGVFSLEDALKVVAARGRLIESLPEGRMLGVSLAEEKLLPRLGSELDLAAVNAPAVCTVSGPEEALERLCRELAEEGVAARWLETSHAFHSAAMEPALPELERIVAGVERRPPSIPFLSNVTGTWIRPEEATDPAYWASHLRRTVRFSACVAEALGAAGKTVIEVGPGSALAALVRRHPDAKAAGPVIPTGTDVPSVLAALGRFWIAGGKVDWNAFQEGLRKRRVPLPTYPFERKRYWKESAEVSPTATNAREAPAEVRNPMSDWFYVPVWSPAPLLSGDTRVRGRWLVFLDEAGLGAEMVAELRRRGVDAVEIRPGDDIPYEPRPDFVAHLWSVTSEPPEPDTDLEAALGRGYYSLLHLAQELDRRHPGKPVEIGLIANHTQAVLEGDRLSPAKAMLPGLGMAVSQELRSLSCRSFDVDLAGDLGELARALLAEIDASAPELAVAYRGGERWQRWLQGFRRLEEAELEGAPRLRPRGVYWITGGLGKLGLLLAEYLARTVQARLILTGRSEPGEEARRHLAAIEAAGGEVLTLAVDVADREGMARALAEARSRFGGVNGVVHAAGVVSGRTIASVRELDREKVDQQLRPKVLGTLVLDELLRDEPLDFFLPFSSLSSVLGGIGFGAYAPANRFLDAMAHERSRRGGVPWISLDWCAWRFGPVSALGWGQEGSITSEEASEVFARTFALPSRPQVVVTTVDLEPALDLWVRRRKTRPAAPRAAAVASPPVVEDTGGDRVEREIAAIWRELLGVDRIDLDRSFTDLGGDSLLALDVLARIRQTLGVDLPLREMFDAPSVVRLAQRVRERTAPPVLPADEPARVLPERLVEIRAGGPRRPLFLVHPAGGHVFGYRPLAEGLSPDRPIYGLEARGVEGDAAPFDNIPEMAEHYLSSVRKLQPRGPYLLGGGSMGGAIAWEMALQLRQTGEEVALLAMFDTPGGGQIPLGIGDEADELAFLIGGTGIAAFADELRPLAPEERLRRATGRAMEIGLLPETLEPERALSLLAVFQKHNEAMRRYEARRYPGGPGRIVFFRARERNPFLEANPETSWIDLAESGVEVQVVPGDHRTLYLPPHAEGLAKRLQAVLDAIL
jgi:acyl transferase domain-containing protein/thioesterase domain-containing protein/acyl carrier protein